ncbi:ABC transporter permease subunit [Prosthecomicrobium sp. N25]|uniref:ABC transporter permease subunit n=1 Tax=Prosthecomicrobium sp. N25 TaxID=3129254 RepID=UPI0030788AD4
MNAKPAAAPARTDFDKPVIWLLTLAVAVPLVIFFLYPVVQILGRSLSTPTGWGLDNFSAAFGTRRFANLLWNTLVMAGISVSATVVLAFGYAYALQRTAVPLKPVFRIVALLPLFAPSLVQGQGLLLLLGRNGLVNRQFGLGFDIYGMVGVIVANVLYAFPYAFLILSAALAVADQRLYESARTLGASGFRMFRDITLPGAKFGIVAAVFVCTTLIVTDFGNPMVIGGDFNVLATEVYNQVIGQAQFERGAVIGIVLLVPAAILKFAEKWLTRRQFALVTAHSKPLVVEPSLGRDLAFTAYAVLVASAFVAVIGIVFWASFVTLWPYNMALTWKHYEFDVQNGTEPIWNSIMVSLFAAMAGVVATSLAAIVLHKFRTPLTPVLALLAVLPAAVPGMVLGLGYILVFNDPSTPLNALYGTFAIIVILNVYYNHAQGFLVVSTSIKQIASSFDEAATTLGAGVLKTLRSVTIPLLWPTMLGVAVFYFMRSMVSLSAVIFLITPSTQVAAVSVLQLSDRGAYNQAAAFSVCIMAVVVVALLSVRAVLHLAGVRNVALIR